MEGQDLTIQNEGPTIRPPLDIAHLLGLCIQEISTGRTHDEALDGARHWVQEQGYSEPEALDAVSRVRETILLLPLASRTTTTSTPGSPAQNPLGEGFVKSPLTDQPQETSAPNKSLPAEAPPPWLTTLLAALNTKGPTKERRKRLPDPQRFNGTRSEYPGWRLAITGKFAADGDDYTTSELYCQYVYSRLEGKARTIATPFMESCQKSGYDTDRLWTFLDSCFKDHHVETRARDKITHMKQSKREVREYLYDFEEQWLRAGLGDNDMMKMTLFRNGLKDEIQSRLIGVPINSYTTLQDRAIEISDDMFRYRIHNKPSGKAGFRSSNAGSSRYSRKKSHSPSGDEMDGVEYTGKNDLSDGEWERRRTRNLCYNCGKKDHISRSCPRRWGSSKKKPQNRSITSAKAAEKEERRASCSSKSSRGRKTTVEEVSSRDDTPDGSSDDELSGKE